MYVRLDRLLSKLQYLRIEKNNAERQKISIICDAGDKYADAYGF